jgi:hypothetical protein
MKSLLLVLFTVFSFVCQAAPSLKQQAQAETKISGQSQNSATDAQVSGMIKLKDPRPEIITRKWKYFASLSVQAFQPQGSVELENASTFDLGANDQTIMPGLEVGILSPLLTTQKVLWQFGVRGKAAMASQSSDVKFNSGYNVDDARLNTTLLSVGPTFSFAWERLPWLALTLSPQWGTLNYTQTSANDFAHFSKYSGYESLNYGFDFKISQKWSFFTEWSQRNLKDNGNKIALKKDNFELGTKVTW